MRLMVVFLLLILSPNVFCQAKINTALQQKIIAMFKQDQLWRIEQNNLENGKTSIFDEAAINLNMGKTDSLNRLAAKRIIRRYGFPGYNLVGEKGSSAFWAIIQHCDQDVNFQQQVLTLMEKEVKRKNASGEDFALLQDRVLVNQGHKQLYGTQVRVDLTTHHAKPFPIQDSLTVDARRKAVGLSPLNDYLKLFERH